MEKRIKEKVEVIVDRVEFIKENISEDFISNRILRKAIYKEYLLKFSEVILDWISKY